MSVRAKFKCMSKTEHYTGQWEVRFLPVMHNRKGDYDVPAENKEFYESTPGGELVLQVVRTGTAERFKPGRSYYLDFTEAPE